MQDTSRRLACNDFVRRTFTESKRRAKPRVIRKRQLPHAYTTGGTENSEPELYRHRNPTEFRNYANQPKEDESAGQCLATVAFDESFFPAASSGLAARSGIRRSGPAATRLPASGEKYEGDGEEHDG
jgi:hypothetical protein